MRVKSQHNSKRNKTLRHVVVALFIVALGMLAPRFFSAIISVVMTPIHTVNTWLETSSDLIPTFFRDRRDLLTEIETLEQELAVSNRTNLTQRRLFEENNRLRSLLDINGEDRIAAAVIARPSELPYDYLQIDRGSDHGIAVGAPVFVGQDVVIGLVAHTAPSYAFVQLITTSGFTASAFVSGPNVVVPMDGIGGGVARVRVPQGVPLAVGNLVYLPSVEPGVYGRISYIENLPTQPEQYGYITPDIALSGLFQVAVGKQSQIAQSPEEINATVRDIMSKSLYQKGLIKHATTTPNQPATTTNETTL